MCTIRRSSGTPSPAPCKWRRGFVRLAAFDGVAFGGPDYYDYVAGTIKQVFDDIYFANRQGISTKGKPCVLFMTHGGGGEGMKPFTSLAHDFRIVADPFVCEGVPHEADRGPLDLGKALGRAVLGTKFGEPASRE